MSAGANGVVFGLAIAGVIASYTLVDKRGLDYATPIAYLEDLDDRAGRPLRSLGGSHAGAVPWRFEASSTVLDRRRNRDVHGVRARARRAASAALPAASVAAVRETSVVIATLLAARWC